MGWKSRRIGKDIGVGMKKSIQFSGFKVGKPHFCGKQWMHSKEKVGATDQLECRSAPETRVRSRGLILNGDI
jgi:hypothetical protein